VSRQLLLPLPLLLNHSSGTTLAPLRLTASLKTLSLADMNPSTYMDFLAYNKAKLKIGEMVRSKEPVDIYVLEDLIEFVIDYENYVK
jgi:hypothetical protein